MKLYTASHSTNAVYLNSVSFLERKKSAFEVTKLSLCYSIMALNQIFTNSTKLKPLETTTTLFFSQLVISTWWTCRHVTWEASILSFVLKKTIIWGKPTKTSLLGYKKKTDTDNSYPIQGKHNFHLCKGKYAFFILQALYIKIWATSWSCP